MRRREVRVALEVRERAHPQQIAPFHLKVLLRAGELVALAGGQDLQPEIATARPSFAAHRRRIPAGADLAGAATTVAQVQSDAARRLTRCDPHRPAYERPCKLQLDDRAVGQVPLGGQ